MKSHFRRVVAVLVLILSIQYAPVATAATRDRDDFSTTIARIIHKIQRVIGLIPLNEGIIPPIP